MSELVEWYRAQLDEDECVARAAGPHGHSSWHADGMQVRGEQGHLVVKHSWPLEIAHIARHDPARVLREVAAKRAIVDDSGPVGGCAGHPGPYLPHGDYGRGYCRRWAEDDLTLRHLASAYADRPGYREEWRP